ncbi:MAG: hypothetical protein Q9198_010696 [Flavoplaca austrocitrina]
MAADLEKGEHGGVSPFASSDGTGSKQEKAADVPDEPQRSKGKTALIMLALCIAVFLAALDTTIITTAVPTIAARFNASAADYTWIGSAYLLAAASSTPIWGKFSDIWGRKPILLVANVVFLVASLIAALSINVKMLLAGRAIQGIGGGGLIILSNICISDLFSMRYVDLQTSLKYETSLDMLIPISQRTREVFRNDWRCLGARKCSGTNPRRCLHREGIMALVLLHQL